MPVRCALHQIHPTQIRTKPTNCTPTRPRHTTLTTFTLKRLRPTLHLRRLHPIRGNTHGRGSMPRSGVVWSGFRVIIPLIGENPLTVAVRVLILAGAEGVDKSHQTKSAHDKRDRDQKRQDLHGLPQTQRVQGHGDRTGRHCQCGNQRRRKPCNRQRHRDQVIDGGNPEILPDAFCGLLRHVAGVGNRRKISGCS